MGYAIDMMDEIAKILNVSYKVYMSPDRSSGRQLPNGSWTGMIGELTNGVSINLLNSHKVKVHHESVFNPVVDYCE